MECISNNMIGNQFENLHSLLKTDMQDFFSYEELFNNIKNYILFYRNKNPFISNENFNITFTEYNEKSLINNLEQILENFGSTYNHIQEYCNSVRSTYETDTINQEIRNIEKEILTNEKEIEKLINNKKDGEDNHVLIKVSKNKHIIEKKEKNNKDKIFLNTEINKNKQIIKELQIKKLELNNELEIKKATMQEK
jgi:hypothetical protein